MSTQAIKQIEEKTVASEITLMVWSDRMDLVALANVKGEVSLHRLSWTKAWTLNSPNEGWSVKAITWRPDGKIIAIGYSSGQVILVKVENKSVLHTVEVGSEVTCVCWIQEAKDSSKSLEESIQEKYMSYIDKSTTYLPEPSIQDFNGSSAPEDFKKNNILQHQRDLNLLLIGTSTGTVHIRVFGCFPCAMIDFNLATNSEVRIENIHLTTELTNMLVTVRDKYNVVKIVSYDCSIFQTHSSELFALALKHIKLISLINYLSHTITTITESWESILMEMDHKLSKYASKVAVGEVTADFLELLMFGISSDNMKEFLLVDLTKKGIEKFGQSIEMSYTNIHQLLLKYVMKFGQNITFHLAELRGMARLLHRYEILGLSEEKITTAISSNGSFLIKGGEMQQIINHSIVNYKAFFRWLYTSIMHLLDEPIPNELPKMTQQDLVYITEFIQNFDNIGNTTSQSQFKMERLGQYLCDSPLKIKSRTGHNDWTKFLQQNSCVQDHPSVFKHYEDMSLLQQYKHLKDAIDDIFVAPQAAINSQMVGLHTVNCFVATEDTLRMSQVNVDKERVLLAFLRPKEQIYMVEMRSKGPHGGRKGVLYFRHFLDEQAPAEGHYDVVDVTFYGAGVLSALLVENTKARVGVLCQVAVGAALEQFGATGDAEEVLFGDEGGLVSVDATQLVPRLFKRVDGMTPAQFAISGSRRVGIVLSDNLRKVKLYELEGEEEEDEDADMSQNARDMSDMNLDEEC